MSRPATESNPASALQHLLATPGKGAHGRVAAIVGESSAAWSRYCKGHKKPGADKIRDWSKRTGTFIGAMAGTWGAMHAPKAGA